MGQNGILIYQPIPAVSIHKCAASLISIKDPDNEVRNLSLLVYPDLDSIRILTIKRFNADLPNKIVFSICIKDNKINFNSITAVFDSKSVSYTHLTLPTICSVQISVVAVSLKKKHKKTMNVCAQVIKQTL
eukprot:TRINITY_DN1336_c0_g1_i2.p1 TRINITY_DN1336_c0_g1~~TRINITY_DN1336_c0_g1_i2.p1  ORF type:complete len:131 (-),score=5.40 TRINITY_DN1336_c0_g1_i2:17-409(-)